MRTFEIMNYGGLNTRLVAVLFFVVIADFQIIQHEDMFSKVPAVKDSTSDLLGDNRGLIFYNSQGNGLMGVRPEAPLILYFRSDYCTWCRKFEEEVTVGGRLDKGGFTLVGVDIVQRGDLVNRFNVIGTPTFVFLNADGREVTRIVGYADEKRFNGALGLFK